MAKSKARERIFVQIVSYRDPQCHWTIKDMFEKAAHPERLRVGLCWQYDPVKDKAYLEVDYPRRQQVQVIQYHVRDAAGAGWARNQAQALYQGEEYILQIQAHMRFEPGWDESLIDMLKRCPSEKPLISAYAPPYTPPDERWHYEDHILRICIRRMGKPDDPQMIHLTGTPIPATDTARGGLYASPFWIGNVMFCRPELLAEVPNDPYIYFFGEELAYSARLFTHGWDIFQPDRIVLYHQWIRRETLGRQEYRNFRSERNQQSLARVRHLLGFAEAGDASVLTGLERYGLGAARPLADFWQFAGIDWQKRTVSEEARKGRWNMAARDNSRKKKPAKKTVPATATTRLPRIFVQIAAYRDPDCQWTVKDMFEKAAHPERIFAGICWQFVGDEDGICFKEPYPRPRQVRVQEVDAKQSQGVCWARSQTQKLWEGEEFTFQIDSHMRFEPGWDDMLLSMWEDCRDEKAVLTCYPPGFTPPNQQERDWIFGMSAKHFDQYGILLMTGAPSFRVGKTEPAHPVPGAFASANMLFGPSSIIKDVPYDPHLYFFGEEISIGVRLWTSGYNLYHPNRLVIFHDWDRNKRPTHFSDHRDWGPRNDRAFARVRHMLGVERSDRPEVLAELDRYGLGKARSLAEYEAYTGIHFATKSIGEKALKGEFANLRPFTPQVNAQEKKNARIFVQIASYRDRECQWTIKDLFEKAKNPDRVFVGVCWQFDEKEDQDCFLVSTRPDQVRMLPVDWREADGVCWARHQTQLLWDGEEFTLQIDAHMRFLPGWDEMMIEELAACDAKKPVLTYTPASYTPPNNLEKHPRPTVRRALPFQSDGNIRGKGESLDRPPPHPLGGVFVAAGFVFSRSAIIHEVPYDPYLYFDQEEICYALRLYTHGWDVFSPSRPLLYHYFNGEKESVRPLHWRDLQKENISKIASLRDRGLKRFNHLTGYQVSTDPEVLREIGKYWLGAVRTLEQFEQYSGIDFKRKVASERALRCLFIQDLAKYRERPIVVPEIDQAAKAAAGAAAPKVQPVLDMLDSGDFVPMFQVTDTEKRTRGIEAYAGRHSMLFFLPSSDPGYLRHFFRALDQELAKYPKMDIWQLFVLDEEVDKLIALREEIRTPHVLWADPERKLAQAFGINRGAGPAAASGFMLSPNLKILRRHTSSGPGQLASAMVGDIADAVSQYGRKHRERRTVSELPPALIVPGALSAELCQKLIQSFRTGHTYEGTVGAEEKKAYRPSAKVRVDHVLSGKLLAEVDDKLSRSFFPEIKKIFGFNVTHRELYKVGLYTGEKGGFFRQHRDNFDAPLGYRRVAATIHLNDSYEGGGLHFPEYDENIYRPAAGSGIAFSCSTMHEALPVTKGERFVLVGFFHGDEDEAYRRHYQASKSQPLKINDFTPALRSYPELGTERHFFEEWRAKHVSFEKTNGSAGAAQPVHTNGAAVISGQPAMNVMVNTLGNHRPRKVYESPTALIFDDFLPEEVYKSVYDCAVKMDYERINTGKITRAWHAHDNFPLRSVANLFYYAEGAKRPEGGHAYPTKTELDRFIEHLLAIQPNAQHLTGKQGEWGHFSVTSWLYPQNTGLAFHDDGSGVYTGAYTYFMNPVWKPHWGGLLLLVEEEGNRRVHEHRAANDQLDFYKRQWMHANPLDEMLMETGFARCVFPKRNRIVFIANNAYHSITTVNPAAGDNLRMALAGFFDRKKT